MRERRKQNDRWCNGVAKTSTYKTLATFSFVYKREVRKENMCTHTLNQKRKKNGKNWRFEYSASTNITRAAIYYPNYII